MKSLEYPKSKPVTHCTEVCFASFLSGIFTPMAVINPPEKKLTNRTSVHCFVFNLLKLYLDHQMLGQ